MRDVIDQKSKLNCILFVISMFIRVLLAVFQNHNYILVYVRLMAHSHSHDLMTDAYCCNHRRCLMKTCNVFCCCRHPNRERLAFANAMMDEILDSADKPFGVSNIYICENGD